MRTAENCIKKAVEKIRNTFLPPDYRRIALAVLKFSDKTQDASDQALFQPVASMQIAGFEARGGGASALENHALHY